MSFFRILFSLLIFPSIFALIFPGNSEADRDAKRFLNSYPYHILISDKSGLNSLLFKLFAKTNNKRPFIHYTRIGYTVLAVLQIPIAIIIYYFKINIFELYFWILMGICFIPEILFFIMVFILERKEKTYKKKMGIETETFWDILKSDKKFNALEKQWKHEEAICNAIEPYIRVTNPKKRKATIVTNDIKKVNAILKKDFPNAYTELTTDEKGNKVFCVYCKEKEDRLLVKAFVKKRS